jgi:hypothetical protein
MIKQASIILISFLFISSCQVSSDLESFDVNTIDLSRITGEEFKETSQLQSLMWPAVISAALLTALSANSTKYSNTNSNPNNMDAEWIE